MMSTRSATEADAISMAPRLRPSDLATVQVFGITAEQALLDGVRNSHESWSIVDSDDCPQGMFGVVKAPTPDGWSAIWMLGTPELIKYGVWLLRRTRVWVEKLTLKYKKLYNWEDIRNPDHIRWLKWVGFKFPGHLTTFGKSPVKFTMFHSEYTSCP